MKSFLLLSACTAGCLTLSAAAQTPTMVHGQKVLLDKNGHVVPQAPLTIPLPPAPLVGGADSCVTPDVIIGSGPFTFDTTNATTGTEGQNESICNSAGQIGINRDVWFTWTAGFSGTADLTTCGMSTMDTKVAAYTGNTCPTSSALACNDDTCVLQSEIRFPVTSGNAYSIQLGQWGTGTSTPGSFTINQFTPIPVDDCQLPMVLAGPGTYTFNNTTATQSPEPSACATIYNDYWYTYTATASGMGTLTTCGLITSAYNDTKVAAYDGAGCPTAASLACNDDACGLMSTITWPIVCGQNYTLRVGGFGTGVLIGSFTLSETGTSCGPVNTPYCFGDGSGTACPCGNNGAAGNGCASSVNPNGANLTTSGNSNLANDTLVLLGTGMPNSTCLYFQGTTQISTVFGDGLRCAGGAITRLGTKTNVGGASQYPSGADPSIHVRGGVVAPGTRTYQVWYRNAAAFCTASTFNLTNGVLVTWQ